MVFRPRAIIIPPGGSNVIREDYRADMRKHDYCIVLTAHGDSNHASLNCITNDPTALT
jgi:shikimate kinase